jgi:hypothetical protein
VLEIEIERGIVHGIENEWADVAWLLLDASRFHLVDGREYVGRAPIDLLVDDGFTNPTSEPRQAIIGRCSCGEEGCGSVIARVYELDADTIAWDHFNAGNPPPVALSQPKPGSDAILFDAAQYRDAIQAARDRA